MTLQDEIHALDRIQARCAPAVAVERILQMQPVMDALDAALRQITPAAVVAGRIIVDLSVLMRAISEQVQVAFGPSLDRRGDDVA